MSKTKKIAILAIIAMVLTMMPAALLAATADDTRLAGDDRIATALEIAGAGWSSASAVILAPADQANLVDSLAAAPLAGQEKAPILLTFKGSLDAGVKAKIADLGASKVYVIGAVSDAVAAEVDAIDGVTVEKLAGADRWATADAINAKLTAPAGTFVVGYNAVPDALSVASFAAANNYAIVLANADGTVPASKLVGDKTYLVGGAAVVKDYDGATRLGGADRYATNKAVVEGLSFSFDRVYVANGLSMVDALAASSLAAKYNAPILLSNGSSVPAGEAVKDKLGMVIALGGTSAVSDAVIEALTGEIGNVTVCAIVEKSYDDDTKNQYVEFTVNGKKVSVEALNAAGWDLEFSAGTSKTDPSGSDIFADANTGLLNDTVDPDDYYVQLTLTKGTDIVISKVAKITVKNLNLAATGISDYTLTNSALVGDMNSTKLVVGETATFEEITVTAGSSKEDIEYGSGAFSIKTSDAGVISKSGNVITAQTPGTATITITYGNATKAIAFTVVNDDRDAKSIKVMKVSDDSVITSLKVLKNKGTNLKAEVLDQYGDPLSDVFTVDVSNDTVIEDPISVVGGEFTVTSLNKAGSATLTFKQSDLKLGTLSVTVSDDGVITKKTLNLVKVDNDAKFDDLMSSDIATIADVDSKDDFSTDTTLDRADDFLVIYEVGQYNAAGMKIGSDVLTDLVIVESKAGVLDSATDFYNDDKKLVIVAGDETGTATVKFKSAGVLRQVKVTVIDEGYTIKSISLKTPPTTEYGRTYKWSNVLNYTSTGNDPIVTGITLNKAAAQEIRFEAGSNTFYIDKDSDGEYDGGVLDVPVGTFELAVAGDDLEVTDDGGVDVVVAAIGDEGTIIFKVLDNSGKVVASKSVAIEL
jgi:putative cell wall-binding protein